MQAPIGKNICAIFYYFKRRQVVFCCHVQYKSKVKPKQQSIPGKGSYTVIAGQRFFSIDAQAASSKEPSFHLYYTRFHLLVSGKKRIKIYLFLATKDFRCDYARRPPIFIILYAWCYSFITTYKRFRRLLIPKSLHVRLLIDASE